MDPESKKLLEDNLKLTEENNEMLHYMRRSMRLSRIMSLLYWVIIIGSAVGAFYFLQPYLTQLMSLYGNASSVLKNFKQ